MEKAGKEERLLCEGGNGGDGDGGSPTFVLVLSVFVAVCGSFACGCVVGYSSPAQSGITSDLGLSTADYSLFGSLFTVGGLLGSLCCGKLADYIGRRGAMGLSDVLLLLGWLLIAFSQGTWSLDLGRTLTGFAMGLIVYVIQIYLSEISPKNLRGGLVLLHQLMISFGIASSFISGLITTWRILAIIGAVGCVIQLFGVFFIPESPRWLVKAGHDKSYVAALRVLRGKNIDISLEASEIKVYTEAVGSISEDSVLDIFQMKYAVVLAVTTGLIILAAFSGATAILFYANTIFESAGVSGPLATITVALIQIPPAFLSVLLMDKYGRRPLLLCSAAGMCLGCLSVALSFLMKEYGLMTEFSPYMALTGILIHFAAYPVGMTAIPFLLVYEMFPMNVKGAAGSFTSTIFSLCGFIIAYAFNFMMDWSSSGTFFILTIIDAISIVFVSKLVPETKGRTLEEIQESLTHTLHSNNMHL